jgi:hypothetical protein
MGGFDFSLCSKKFHYILDLVNEIGAIVLYLIVIEQQVENRKFLNFSLKIS